MQQQTENKCENLRKIAKKKPKTSQKGGESKTRRSPRTRLQEGRSPPTEGTMRDYIVRRLTRWGETPAHCAALRGEARQRGGLE